MKEEKRAAVGLGIEKNSINVQESKSGQSVEARGVNSSLKNNSKQDDNRKHFRK